MRQPFSREIGKVPSPLNFSLPPSFGLFATILQQCLQYVWWNRYLYMCPLRPEKPGLHPNLTCVHGDRGCRTPIPGDCVNPIPGGMQKPNPRGDAETSTPGMLRKPGDLAQVCPSPKSLKGLPRATHTDRAQTSGNVIPTVELCLPHLTFRI